MKKLFAILATCFLAIGLFAESYFNPQLGLGFYHLSSGKKTVSTDYGNVEGETTCTQMSINGGLLAAENLFAFENTYDFSFPLSSKLILDGLDFEKELESLDPAINANYKWNNFTLSSYIGIGIAPVVNNNIVLSITGGITGGLKFDTIKIEISKYDNGSYNEQNYFHTYLGIASRLNLNILFGNFGINLFGFAEKELLQLKWTDGIKLGYSTFYKLGGGASFIIQLE